MGSLTAVEYVSVDGVFEDPSWTQPYFDERVGAFQGARMGEAGALLLGRVTYEQMSKAWPAMPDAPGADVMNALPKHVPTTSLGGVRPLWNAAFVTGDVDAEIRALKASTDLLVYGSGRLVQHLLSVGLLDVLHLIQMPVIVGRGRRLFAEDGVRRGLRLTASDTTPSGAALLSYATS